MVKVKLLQYYYSTTTVLLQYYSCPVGVDPNPRGSYQEFLLSFGLCEDGHVVRGEAAVCGGQVDSEETLYRAAACSYAGDAGR